MTVNDARRVGTERGSDALSKWLTKQSGPRRSKGSMAIQKLIAVRAKLFRQRTKAERERMAFAEALVGDPDRNLTAAARACGCARPSQAGQRLFHDPCTQVYIDALVEAGFGCLAEDQQKALRVAMPAADVIRRMSEFGAASMKDFVDVLDPQEGTDTLEAAAGSYPFFNWRKIKQAEKLGLIKKLKIKSGFNQARDGGEPLPWTETELELHDAKHALKELAQMHGLYKKGHELQDQNELLWKAILKEIPAEQLRGLYLRVLGRQAGEVSP